MSLKLVIMVLAENVKVYVLMVWNIDVAIVEEQFAIGGEGEG